MGWTNFIKTAGKGATRLLEGTGKGVGTAAKGIGEGMGATAKGLGGWKGVVGTGAVVTAVNSDHGLTGVASDVMFGQGGSEKVQEHGVAGEALNIAIGEKGKQAVSEATDAVSQQVSNISMPSYTPSAAYNDGQPMGRQLPEQPHERQCQHHVNGSNDCQQFPGLRAFRPSYQGTRSFAWHPYHWQKQPACICPETTNGLCTPSGIAC